jgi:hypothetical protein
MTFSPPKPHTVCSLEGVEFLTLNNKVTMPTLGFGVWRSTPEETATTVETALRTGYRHIDTAAAYQNEREVGEGIRPESTAPKICRDQGVGDRLRVRQDTPCV